MSSKKNIVKINITNEPVGSKKLPYRLNDDANTRRKALLQGIKKTQKKYKVSEKNAALMKKKKLNVLRIYRKKSNPIQCRKITYDIKFLDKKYKFNSTKNICN